MKGVREEELSKLYEITRAINSTLDLKTVLELILKLTNELFKAQAGSIMLLNSDASLTIEAAHGLSDEIVATTRVRLGEGIAGWVAMTGEPLLLEGKVKDPRFTMLVDRKDPIKSALCVPLKTKDKVIGVLMLRRKTSASKFTDEQLRFLSTIADQAAIALENARLVRELKRVSQMKSEIVSMVTHDLKTPLTSIQGFLELVLTRNLPPEKTSRYLTIVQEEAERLVRLINNLLDLSKLEAGEFKLTRRPVDLIRIIKATLSTLGSNEPPNISFHPPAKVPLVLADEDLIIQVIHNLVSNAMKYSPERGNIEIRVAPAGSFVTTEVEDHGIGIPAEKLSQLFSRYYRVDSTATRGIPGTGLGLANVKYIVEAHGGNLSVESHEGRGSIFAFSLPAAP